MSAEWFSGGISRHSLASTTARGRVGGYQAYRRYGALEWLGVMNLKPGRAGTRIHLRIHMVSVRPSGTVLGGARARSCVAYATYRDKIRLQNAVVAVRDGDEEARWMW